MEKVQDVGSVLSYLPGFMHDSAFLDRIHGFIPGWELPKIMKSDVSLASGYGLASDYVAEVLHRFRSESAEGVVNEHFELVGNYTIRDEKAVKNLLSGMIKLFVPNYEFDNRELAELATLATDLRNRVARLLTRMSPQEFPEKELGIRVRG